MEFACVEECSQCCIEREYYPSKKFGKIGVLLLPKEKQRIEELALKNGLDVKIVPRIGTSRNEDAGPTKVLAYQMMGLEQNGNTCPFLDTDSGAKSPHGGFPCKIYDKRPLACTAYPLIDTQPITLDKKCKFCKECGNTEKNLNSEIEALAKIKAEMIPDEQRIWRYATGVGDAKDAKLIRTGWFPEHE